MLDRPSTVQEESQQLAQTSLVVGTARSARRRVDRHRITYLEIDRGTRARDIAVEIALRKASYMARRERLLEQIRQNPNDATLNGRKRPIGLSSEDLPRLPKHG